MSWFSRRRRADARSVLIIVENLPVPFDRRVWQEASTLRDAGYTVSIICPTGKGYDSREEIIDGIHVFRHRMPVEANGALGFLLEYSAALVAELRLSWKVYRKVGFSVIHACNPPDLIFLVATLYKRFFGCKFIFDHHDLCPELYLAKGGERGSFFYRALRVVERRTFRLADVSIATNESYRQVAIERGGMNPDDVYVVRSGPDLNRLRILTPDPAVRQGRRYLVGYLGVMGKQEGIDLLLETVRYLVHDRQRTDVHFALVGGGPELEALRALATDLGIAEFVTFTGRVPDDEMLRVLNSADVCVNPDTVNEMNDKSTMNKVVEYMALSKPLVQFELTEGRVSAGEASLYAAANDPLDLAEKLEVLLADAGLRARMGQIGMERVQTQLSWEHSIPPLLAAYGRVTGGIADVVGGGLQAESSGRLAA